MIIPAKFQNESELKSYIGYRKKIGENSRIAFVDSDGYGSTACTVGLTPHLMYGHLSKVTWPITALCDNETLMAWNPIAAKEALGWTTAETEINPDLSKLKEVAPDWSELLRSGVHPIPAPEFAHVEDDPFGDERDDVESELDEMRIWDSGSKSILDEAGKIIAGDRRQTYGKARESFGRIAQFWSAYLGFEISPIDVANLMILLKVSRSKGKFHRDSFVDICGYAALTEELR